MEDGDTLMPFLSVLGDRKGLTGNRNRPATTCIIRIRCHGIRYRPAARTGCTRSDFDPGLITRNVSRTACSCCQRDASVSALKPKVLARWGNGVGAVQMIVSYIRSGCTSSKDLVTSYATIRPGSPGVLS